MTTFPSLINI